MILCLGTTPAIQRVMVFRKLTLNAVNRAVLTSDDIAGKSVNVAKVLRVLGADVFATGFLGGERGAQLRVALAERGIEQEFVTVPAPTRQCVTVIDQTAGTQTELVEEGRPVEPAAYDELMTIVRRRLPGCQALVLSGTIPAGGPVDLYSRCLRLAHESGALTVADARGAALVEALPAGPGVVKPNRAELAATLGRELHDEAAVLVAMRELRERGAQRVIITAGSEPALAFDGTHFWRVHAPRLTALNPIGSGDAFTAALVWRLVQGDDLGEAVRWGCAAGAANALTLMAGEVDRAEVERLARAVRLDHW